MKQLFVSPGTAQGISSQNLLFGFSIAKSLQSHACSLLVWLKCHQTKSRVLKSFNEVVFLNLCDRHSEVFSIACPYLARKLLFCCTGIHKMDSTYICFLRKFCQGSRMRWILKTNHLVRSIPALPWLIQASHWAQLWLIVIETSRATAIGFINSMIHHIWWNVRKVSKTTHSTH